MSTAIVYAYLPKGFVIGADGRRTDYESAQPVVRDDVQKIFSRVRGSARLTFAWSGATTFAYLKFGFNNIADCVLLDMDFSSLTTFSDFLSKFSHNMTAKLLDLVGTGRSKEWETQPPQVIFLSYFNDEPFVGELVLNPADLTFDIKKSISLLNAERCFYVFTGSKAAWDKFSPENQRPVFDSIHEAANQIRDYIKLCFAYPDNPDRVNPIGGHIHIGRLQPKGFLWIDSPCSHVSC